LQVFEQLYVGSMNTEPVITKTVVYIIQNTTGNDRLYKFKSCLMTWLSIFLVYLSWLRHYLKLDLFYLGTKVFSNSSPHIQHYWKCRKWQDNGGKKGDKSWSSH